MRSLLSFLSCYLWSSVWNVSFSSRCFQNFIFVFGFQKFGYDVPKCVFSLIYYVWDSLLLWSAVCSFSFILGKFDHYLFENILCAIVSIFSYNCNHKCPIILHYPITIGYFILSLFYLLFFFCFVSVWIFHCSNIKFANSFYCYIQTTDSPPNQISTFFLSCILIRLFHNLPMPTEISHMFIRIFVFSTVSFSIFNIC